MTKTHAPLVSQVEVGRLTLVDEDTSPVSQVEVWLVVDVVDEDTPFPVSQVEL